MTDDTTSAATSLLGQTLRGEYRLVSLIGSGAFGEVYLAEQLSGGVVMRSAVVKVLRSDRRAHVGAEQRFQREAQLLACINHPNVVTLYNFGQLETGLFFLAMEYGGDRTLGDVIKTESPLPLARALNIAEQICEALAAAAKQDIIHRDLKPSNVLLRTEDGEDRVKVVDFGIAKMLRDLSTDSDSNTVVSLTGSEVFIGTPAYSSPQQAGGGVVDARSDLYALGVVLYEMLTGRKPFEAPNPQAMLAAHYTVDPTPPMQHVALPVPVNDMVMRLLEKKPEHRYQSARELQRELARLRTTPMEPVLARPRKKRHLALMGVAATVAIGVVGAVFVGHRHAPPPPPPHDASPAITGPRVSLKVEEPTGATVTPAQWPLRGAGSFKVEASGPWTMLVEYEPKGSGWHLAVSSLPLSAVRIDGTLAGNRGEFDLMPGDNKVEVQLKTRERVLRLSFAASQ